MSYTASPRIFELRVNTPNEQKIFSLQAGNSFIFVGPNGSGKSRLAAVFEKSLGESAHRISGHRILSLNPDVVKINEGVARKTLKYGSGTDRASAVNREGNRWGHSEDYYVRPLNDFDVLLQTLFAEQGNTALATHNRVRAGDKGDATPTLLEQLKVIWDDMIIHRRLKITGDNILVEPLSGGKPYKASKMSDGERAVFYLIGQVLCADKDIALIIDEPELHIHRSIMSKLWDRLEAIRPDCAFVFITHDLEFAASRVGHKVAIRSFNPPDIWEFEEVPEDTGFSEEIATLILGSRRPILFVESKGNSLDTAVYRNRYPEWTVVAKGSCEEVIHSVVTMRHNADLTRIMCAGIVDADGRTFAEVSSLNGKGIQVLPVAEIENLFLLPAVARAIGEHEALEEPELTNRIEALTTAVIANVQQGNNLEAAVVRYCRRRIDSILKAVDLSAASTTATLAAAYASTTSSLDIGAIAAERREAINNAITTRNIEALLALYDNKGLLNLISIHIKKTKLDELKSWILRTLTNRKAPAVADALKTVLSDLTPA